MITINDIDVFILSYNRDRYILETIDSLLRQTIGKFTIKILDNGSTDTTEEIIRNLDNKNIEFIGSEKNYGALWNFERAQNLASKKYTIFFHDDDLLHPNYFEYALKAINKYTNIALVCSGMKATHYPNLNHFNTYQYKPLFFNTLADFASLVYLGFPLNFATAIYKTENLKQVKIDFEQYGKILDRPLLYDTVQNEHIILLTGQYVQYRLHLNQDSQNNQTGPFLNEIITLHKKYYAIIFNQKKILPKIFFLINFYQYINEEYKRIPTMKLSKADYIQTAKHTLSISNLHFILSKVSYIFKLAYIYKAYRYCKRTWGEYS